MFRKEWCFWILTNRFFKSIGLFTTFFFDKKPSCLWIWWNLYRILKRPFESSKQKIKINKTFSNWTNIIHGVPQGSILGTLLFNVFLCDLFLFIPSTNFGSHADDNAPFTTGSSELEVINEIKTAAESLTFCFQNNYMKVNPNKFYFRLSDKKFIRWIFVMRSSQVRELKNFWR